jgi:hypothetical protein
MHATCISSWSDHPHNISWEVRIMKLLMTRLFPSVMACFYGSRFLGPVCFLEVASFHFRELWLRKSRRIPRIARLLQNNTVNSYEIFERRAENGTEKVISCHWYSFIFISKKNTGLVDKHIFSSWLAANKQTTHRFHMETFNQDIKWGRV